jgi:iron-sulfur cluster assembly protein
MIQVSEKATSQIKSLMQSENRTSNDFLRIFVKKGGCSGFSYKLDFDSALKDGDKNFDINGLKLVVDKESLLYLIGMTLDFEGGLNGQGFVFSNPNATKTCGCGSSFAV